MEVMTIPAQDFLLCRVLKSLGEDQDAILRVRAGPELWCCDHIMDRGCISESTVCMGAVVFTVFVSCVDHVFLDRLTFKECCSWLGTPESSTTTTTTATTATTSTTTTATTTTAAAAADCYLWLLPLTTYRWLLQVLLCFYFCLNSVYISASQVHFKTLQNSGLWRCSLTTLMMVAPPPQCEYCNK